MTRASEWAYSVDHRQICRVIETQTQALAALFDPVQGPAQAAVVILPARRAQAGKAPAQ